MTSLTLLSRSIVIALLLTSFTSLANAQPASLFWDVASGDWKDESSWFGGFTPPEADFGEIVPVESNV